MDMDTTSPFMMVKLADVHVMNSGKVPPVKMKPGPRLMDMQL
jgi:hypothetical protein